MTIEEIIHRLAVTSDKTFQASIERINKRQRREGKIVLSLEQELEKREGKL